MGTVCQRAAADGRHPAADLEAGRGPGGALGGVLPSAERAEQPGDLHGSRQANADTRPQIPIVGSEGRRAPPADLGANGEPRGGGVPGTGNGTGNVHRSCDETAAVARASPIVKACMAAVIEAAVSQAAVAMEGLRSNGADPDGTNRRGAGDLPSDAVSRLQRRDCPTLLWVGALRKTG